MPKAFLGSQGTTLRGVLEQYLGYRKQKKHKMTVSLVLRQLRQPKLPLMVLVGRHLETTPMVSKGF